MSRTTKYPFDEWFNGELHILCNGVHFQYKDVTVLVYHIKRTAAKRGEDLVHVRSIGRFVYVFNRRRSTKWQPFVGFWRPLHRCVKPTTSQR